MFEQAFKKIDTILRREGGGVLKYTEQSSWILFLKYLDELEVDNNNEAQLKGKECGSIVEKQYRWSDWAAPKNKEGKIDHNNVLIGDDLIDFVNKKLFPYLKGFKQRAVSPNTIEYKIGQIFSETKNEINSGYNLREIVEVIDELNFQSQKERHELSYLYEEKIRNMGNAGRDGGSYYTPRPLICTIVKVVNPEVGERVYDGAVGSAGFLCEAFVHMKSKKGLSTGQLRTIQEKSLYGKEKDKLAYLIAIMNMILHGIKAPNIIHANTLSENILDIQERDRYDVVLANPPFGGKERKEVQQNFPVRTSETAFLFLQHFIKILKAGGRAGIVIKNTFLSNGGAGSAEAQLRRQLLENCSLHTILDLPGGTFAGAGVKTVVLFFDKGAKTKKIWYYQLNLDRNLGKTNPLNEDDLAEFVKLQKTKSDSENSWSVNVGDVDPEAFNLSVSNPHKKDEAVFREPKEILSEMEDLDAKADDILKTIRELI